MRALLRASAVTWRVLAGAVSALDVGLHEAVLVAGLLLLAAGLRDVYAPLAYIIPGAILVWLAIPARPSEPPQTRRRLR